MSTVLLAEDDPDIRHLVSAELVRHGFDVIETGDDDALAAIRREGPDLVLLDLRRPGLEGLEVIRELRADPGTAGLPVIVLAAHAEAFGLDGTECVVKPFRPQDLVRRVESALGRR